MWLILFPCRYEKRGKIFLQLWRPSQVLSKGENKARWWCVWRPRKKNAHWSTDFFFHACAERTPLQDLRRRIFSLSATIFSQCQSVKNCISTWLYIFSWSLTIWNSPFKRVTFSAIWGFKIRVLLWLQDPFILTHYQTRNSLVALRTRKKDFPLLKWDVIDSGGKRT